MATKRTTQWKRASDFRYVSSDGNYAIHIYPDATAPVRISKRYEALGLMELTPSVRFMDLRQAMDYDLKQIDAACRIALRALYGKELDFPREDWKVQHEFDDEPTYVTHDDFGDYDDEADGVSLGAELPVELRKGLARVIQSVLNNDLLEAQQRLAELPDMAQPTEDGSKHALRRALEVVIEKMNLVNRGQDLLVDRRVLYDLLYAAAVSIDEDLDRYARFTQLRPDMGPEE